VFENELKQISKQAIDLISSKSIDFKDSSYTIISISTTTILKDFKSITSNEENYWKASLLWLTPDGKDIKEDYVVVAETVNEGIEIIINKVPDTSLENINGMTPLKITSIIK
jgi:hypothetical protein